MHAPAHRCLAVWLLATAAAAGLVAWLVPVALAPATDFADALVRCCAAAAVLATCWLWLVTSAAVVEAVTGAAAPGVPTPVRRLVLAACGVAVVAGIAVPAHATPGEQHRDRRPATAISGLPFPDRAVTPERPAEVVVVRPGDSLWEIATDDLGEASAADVDARWREIYAANRDAIGPDPDLIRPAQRLRLPARHDQ